ncbi:Xylanolytic transcriptional activator xlnR [Ceratocystis platani]|uniref:Xylanolytic transcriptional activator xlnR n=1 Tax=Ceratocystis fimbriata f. sp. platani TaxID=88771 RepID=A0A0F8BMF9_CERFI|nr:Xylanolytic transcriptional activator xlnR [Ceratocystis platani]
MFGAARTLDDVVTYMHLATMVSAKLKLCRELPSRGHISCTERAADVDIEAGADCNANTSGQEDVGLRAFYTEEEREERRRVWWLAYTIDRHLALCYNRPLFLLDRECEGLLRPMDDVAWQQGNFTLPLSTETPGADIDGQLGSEAHSHTHSPLPRSQHGPSYECTSHSIFGYFLPLMTILGEIVELHQAQNHPRFGPAFRVSQECAKQISSVVHHLEIYEHSLASFEQRHTSAERSDQRSDAPTPSLSVHSAHSGSSVPTRMSESDIQTHIVTAYGTHVMHVLHILLADKWDPIDLLDNASQWMSSPAFSSATSHAIAAAEAISRILDYDPGLEFMPFFFGIYLLQGSVLLLLIASKVPQGDGAAPVARACETIIRAHEACVVTLNTEYQRNFNKVMRSALAQIRGRAVADLQEAQQRRRELLSLYRWTGDGMGLAL